MQVAVAGGEAIQAVQHHGDAVGVAALHPPLAVMGGPYGGARTAGDVQGGMPGSDSLGDHPGHGMEELDGWQQQREG